jgi:endonuclease YncB( thermonuclease family)
MLRGALTGRVAHVVDGDTLDVIVEGKRIRVRLLDIDAPAQK